jgi:hypothetical protein
VQTPGGHPVRDPLLAESKLKQLASRNNAVLSLDQAPEGSGPIASAAASTWLKDFTPMGDKSLQRAVLPPPGRCLPPPASAVLA